MRVMIENGGHSASMEPKTTRVASPGFESDQPA
jgi:hypothetical protein